LTTINRPDTILTMQNLTNFQAKLLANFLSDISKGSFLAALGYPFFAQLSWSTRISAFTSGILGGIVFLRLALETGKGVIND